jgi:hypothetical protein
MTNLMIKAKALYTYIGEGLTYPYLKTVKPFPVMG